MFSTQALRLLRERWRDPTDLAEELYAILSSVNLPLSHGGPITIDAGAGGQPAITLRGFDDNGVAIRIERSNGVFLDIGPSYLDLGGGEVRNGTTPGGQQQQDPGGNVFTGEVISGSGANYTVQLRSGEQVPATQLQIASGEVIPAGTAVILVREDGAYYMQAPVWLDDS